MQDTSDLSPAQKLMIEDGLPTTALVPQSERAESWKGRKLTKPKDLKIPTKDEDPATKQLRKEMAAAEERKKAERLARLKELKSNAAKAASKETDMTKTAKKTPKASQAKPAGKASAPTARRAAPKAKTSPRAATVAGKAPPKERKQSKSELVHSMLTAPGGATRKELSEATGWPSVNLNVAAARADMVLKEDEATGKCRLVKA